MSDPTRKIIHVDMDAFYACSTISPHGSTSDGVSGRSSNRPAITTTSTDQAPITPFLHPAGRIRADRPRHRRVERSGCDLSDLDRCVPQHLRDHLRQIDGPWSSGSTASDARVRRRFRTFDRQPSSAPIPRLRIVHRSGAIRTLVVIVEVDVDGTATPHIMDFSVRGDRFGGIISRCVPFSRCRARLFRSSEARTLRPPPSRHLPRRRRFDQPAARTSCAAVRRCRSGCRRC